MTTPAFVIEGREYQFVPLDEFNMGEAMILYDYSSLSLDDVKDNAGNPGVMAAFLHVAYARGNPHLSRAQVRAIVEAVNLLDLVEQIAKFIDAEDDAGPPAQKPNGDEHEKPNGSEQSSGVASTLSSDGPASRLHRIGGQRSDTSATSASATSN